MPSDFCSICSSHLLITYQTELHKLFSVVFYFYHPHTTEKQKNQTTGLNNPVRSFYVLFSFPYGKTFQNVYFGGAVCPCCLYLSCLQEMEPHLKRWSTMVPWTKTREKDENSAALQGLRCSQEMLPKTDGRLSSFSQFCPF